MIRLKVRSDLSMVQIKLGLGLLGCSTCRPRGSLLLFCWHFWRYFDFFDDFGVVGTGYFDLSPARTVMTKTQQWESAAPHTLSVAELNRDGYRYWGYYGLTNCGGIGLARSWPTSSPQESVALPLPTPESSGSFRPAMTRLSTSSPSSSGITMSSSATS